MESSSTLFEISIPRGALENKIMNLLKINIILAISHRCTVSQTFFTIGTRVKLFQYIPCTSKTVTIKMIYLKLYLETSLH